ncbi:acetoacetate decarboxylase family protein (plasmid) [Nocardioides sp. R1-1]|uniref:acetoacetate decarboxylase family protein n=1 Tax=Nocardioides sp. R1-1 TaxID=3383502 RepID=UPI0038D0C93C
MMSFRKSPEDIARINATLQNKRLSGERLEVAFRSDPDVIAKIMPKPLKPAGTDKVVVRVTRWVTNYCGTFTMAGLYLDAEHDGQSGEYVLSMFIDSYDAALLIGREGFGEPKKMGSVELVRCGNSFMGTVDRLGTRLMTLKVEAGEDLGPSKGSQAGNLYSIKATLDLDGTLQGDAFLMAQQLEVNSSETRTGPGSLVLGGSPHDPIDEFPILEVLSGSYAVQELYGSRYPDGGYQRAVIPGEEFLPYHYGRLDDWSAHDVLSGLRGA